MRLAPSLVRCVVVGLAVALAVPQPGPAQTRSGARLGNSAGAPRPAVLRALAPTGKLRVALVAGAPTTLLRGPTLEQSRGVGFELGRELAKRLGVPFQPVAYATPAAVMAGAQSGEWDVAFLARTPERERAFDLTPSFLSIEQSYIVPSGSSITSLAAVDRSGIRIGAPQGGSVNLALTATIRNATIVPVAGLAIAAEMLRAGQIDAFAANKANLFELSAKLAGSRILEGRIGVDEYVIGLPKGREAALAYVSDFLRQSGSAGLVSAAIRRADLHGVIEQP